MKPARAAAGSALFFVLAPGVVDGLVPWWLTRWHVRAHGAPAGGRALGMLVLVLGIAALLDAFVRFVRAGRGTPSPTHPTERLVVSGPYRYTRNPMYLAVLAIIVGQALLLWRVELLLYAAAAALAVHVWVHVYEEPTLRRRFGDEYERYRSAVPRWWPRRSAWRG